VFDLGLVKVVEVVNDRDLIGAAAKQTIDKMRTDKTRAAGDEKLFHRSFVA
jgi:hypothetical protein